MTSNIDSLNYYRAYLKRCAESFNTYPPEGEIERETRAAIILQGAIRRAFYLSLLDAERNSNSFRSRYNWNVNGGSLTVYLPVAIKGLERRKWMEENIENPDPHREGERERIQGVINRKLASPIRVDLKDAENVPDRSSHWPGDDSRPSLAQVVAEEKAHNIKKQRPAVKELGTEKLKQLILRIFDEIRDTDYSDGKLAHDFGLSKGTFSRFAGSKWYKKETSLPDLWRNTAKILAQDPAFEGISKTFQKQIQGTIERDKRNK